MRKAALYSALFLLLFAFHLTMPTVLPAQSQAGTGQIVGTVFDPTGAAILGATVTVANKDTGWTREMESNEAGQYRFVLLPPGRYTVTVKKAGFKVSKVEVEVTVGAAPTVDATLIVGDVTQVVEVTATALIQTTTPASDALINSKSIAELPINCRRFHDFVTLTPTVQIEPERNQISFVGQRGINSNVTIDGADYNGPFFGGMRGGERSNNAFSIPQEAISQFQVVPYGYSAEFGRSTGGIMNAVTKSGTNDWHGSAFYFLRHKELAKKDAFDRQALEEQHQFGGSIGGPIRRDKSFFFFAIEDQQFDTPRIVIFRNLVGVTPTPFFTEGFNFYKSLEGPFTQTNDAISFLGRWDQQFNPNHRLAVRYHYSKNDGLNAVATGEQIQPETEAALSNNGTEGDKTNTVTGTWTGIFSARVVNELRAQYSREDRPRTANALQAGVGNLIGDYGTRGFLPTTAFDYRVQVANNLTWNYGRHSVRFGGEFSYLFVDQFFKFNQFGIFSISGSSVPTLLAIMTPGRDPAVSGDPANRLDSTAVTYRVNIGNGKLATSMRELAFFVHDAWRVTPRFTITAGFRWEGYFNPEPDTSNTALTTLVRNFTFPFGKVDPGFIPDNLRQYMPRLGIAWDPWGNAKTVIRANAGIYYARTPLLLFAAPLNNFRTPAGDLSVRLPLSLPTGFVCTPIATGDNCRTIYWQLRRIGIDLNNLALDKLPTLTLQNIQDIAGALGLTFDPNRAVAPLTWADNYESPRSWQWSVGVEREVARGWSVGGDFVYVNTVHLERNRDWNLPSPVIPATDQSLRPCFGLRGGTPCSTRSRPIDNLDSVQVRESNGRSLYRGFTLRSAFRRSRYQFQAYYTLSKSLSDDDNERRAGGPEYENAFNVEPEYSFARIDARHLFLFNGLVDLPWGFAVSGLARLRSARPIDPLTGADSNGDFGGPDRPFQAPGVPFKRHSFRDRAAYNTDLRVAKRFNLPREGMRIDLTVDFFNLFNFDNITYVTGRGTGANRTYGLGISTAGTSVPIDPRFRRLQAPSFCTSNKSCYDTNNFPGPPFQMQVGLRFQF